jgi:hypothetical protein
MTKPREQRPVKRDRFIDWRKEMKLTMTNGERLVVNYMIREKDPRAGGRGIDISGARIISELRDSLKMFDLEIQTDEDAEKAIEYEISRLELEWLRDEIEKASEGKRFPAVYAVFIVRLYDRVRSALTDEKIR